MEFIWQLQIIHRMKDVLPVAIDKGNTILKSSLNYKAVFYLPSLRFQKIVCRGDLTHVGQFWVSPICGDVYFEKRVLLVSN